MTSSPERKAYMLAWHAKNKERVRAYRHKWRSANKDKVSAVNKRSHLKYAYGLTEAQYARMLLEQNGCCAICKRPRTQFKYSFHVDHDHATGRVRGLLCSNCNSGLGKFQESLAIFDSAMKYLRGSN